MKTRKYAAPAVEGLKGKQYFQMYIFNCEINPLNANHDTTRFLDIFIKYVFVR